MISDPTRRFKIRTQESDSLAEVVPRLTGDGDFPQIVGRTDPRGKKNAEERARLVTSPQHIPMRFTGILSAEV